MLAIIIIIGAALATAASLGLSAFFQQLEDFAQRAQNFNDLMDEADELSNKEGEQ